MARDKNEIYGVPDKENPEWTKLDFERAGNFSDMFPAIHAKRLRGKQKSPTKEMISLRLDREVLKKFRATGPGWQKRISDAVAKAADGF